MDDRYPQEVLTDEAYDELDDGTMPSNVETLTDNVIGHRIVKAEKRDVPHSWRGTVEAFVITLDNGREVRLSDSSDCCAYTELQEFLLHPELVDHVIMGVGTTEKYTKWHIYADYGDILELTVAWSCGNPFYYGYGFDIEVVDLGGV